MLNDFSKLAHYRLTIWIITSVVAISTLGLALYSNVKLNDKIAIINDLYCIIESIDRSNTVIRNSIFAPTSELKNLELEKRFVNRERVDNIIRRTNKIHFHHFNDAQKKKISRNCKI